METTFVELDRAGRVVLPKRVREEVRAGRFLVHVEDHDRVVLIPVKSTREMFGSLPRLNIDAFRREHAKER